MPLSKLIERKIKLKSGGDIVQVYGPFVFLDGTANEVWIKRNGEFDTTYVFYSGDKYEIFENFESLSIFTRDRQDKMNKNLNSKISHLSREIDDLKLRKLIIYTAIVITIAILIFIMASIFYGVPGTYQAYAFVLIACLLATACVFLFGKFVVPKLPSFPN